MLLFLFFHQPFLDATDGIAEIHSDFKQFPEIGCEGQSIMLLIDLLQGFLGRSFQFEFHHVNIVRSLHHKVNPAFRGMIFRLRIESQKLEDDKQHILIVPFQIACQFIGTIRKETLQAFHEGIDLSAAHFLYKAGQLECGVSGRQVRIVRKQELGKSLFGNPKV